MFGNRAEGREVKAGARALPNDVTASVCFGFSLDLVSGRGRNAKRVNGCRMALTENTYNTLPVRHIPRRWVMACAARAFFSFLPGDPI